MNNKKVFSNMIWRFAERVGAQMIALVVSIVLARILDPSAYGTVALINVFTIILQVFVDSGLGNALIQKKDADNLDFSTVFFANIIFCSVLYCLLFLFAPLISNFYGEESITIYMRVLGLTVLISGIKNVQQAYVSRNMLFKKFFFSTIGGTVVAGAVGITMALMGFGVWSLIAQQIVNTAIDTIILWITVKWRPVFAFSFKKLKGLFSYGWKLLVSALMDTMYSNLSSLIIGKKYSASDLAYYNQGDKFPRLIVGNINTAIDSVLLPAMSNEQDNKLVVKNMTRRAIKVGIYVMAPLMLGFATCAESFVGLVLTEKWLPSVFFIQIFCLTYVLYPISTANLNAIKAMGRSDLFLKLEIVKKCVGLAILIFSMVFGIKSIAIGVLITSIISQAINAYPNKKLLEYGYGEQLKDVFPSLFLSFIMAFLIYPIQFLEFSYLITLSIQVLIGILIYVIGSKLLKLESFEYLIELIKSYVYGKRSY